ncbi:MAG: zinc ribbon domain-containing protein, partial [Synergistaceae bacterium]|nr:zinc ribbon domain-containing protein [Synergistaceae bacterium]
MIENDEFTIHRDSREEAEVKCPECGAEIRGGLRYCTSCGAPVSEDGHPPLSEAPRQENEDSRLPRGTGRRVRSNADRAERSYRQFNAVARPRRRKNERRSRLPVLLLLFVLVAALGGGVYSFM